MEQFFSTNVPTGVHCLIFLLAIVAVAPLQIHGKVIVDVNHALRPPVQAKSITRSVPEKLLVRQI